MGDEDAIDAAYLMPKHLLPKVGSGIYYQRGAVTLYQYAAAQALVFGVHRSAYITIAGYHGYATAGAGTKKGDFECSHIPNAWRK
jgi:hypothetical protein